MSLAIIVVLRDVDPEVSIYNTRRRAKSLLHHELLVLTLQVVGLKVN